MVNKPKRSRMECIINILEKYICCRGNRKYLQENSGKTTFYWEYAIIMQIVLLMSFNWWSLGGELRETPYSSLLGEHWQQRGLVQLSARPIKCPFFPCGKCGGFGRPPREDRHHTLHSTFGGGTKCCTFSFLCSYL